MISQEPYMGRNPSLVPVSNSEIQVFKDCRRKWWLQYYRGLARKKKEMVSPLTLGSRIHNALEAYYKEGKNPVEVYVTLLEVDEEIFIASGDDQNEDKKKAFYSDAELGRIMIEGYIDWLDETGKDADIEVVGVEEKISAIVQEGRVELQGKTDLKVRDRSNNARLIMDHKSAISFQTYYNTAHMSEQLMLYAMLERMSNPGDLTNVEGGIYNLLRKVKRTAKSKPPFYDRITVRFNDDTLRSFWTRVNGVLHDMMAVRDALDAGADPKYVAYPSPTNDCTWKCPFYQACPMFDDGSAVELWLDEFTEVHDPYARYSDSGENE